MSALAKVVNPLMIPEVIHEVSSLCNNIVEYRKLTLQTEFAREQMHRQADIVLSEQKQAHDQEMKRLRSLSKGYHQTTKNICHESDKFFQLLESSQRNIENMQTLLLSSKTDNEDKAMLQAQLANLQDQRSLLISEHARNASGHLHAFSILSDSLRTQPREFSGEFKDVSY